MAKTINKVALDSDDRVFAEPEIISPPPIGTPLSTSEPIPGNSSFGPGSSNHGSANSDPDDEFDFLDRPLNSSEYADAGRMRFDGVDDLHIDIRSRFLLDILSDEPRSSLAAPPPATTAPAPVLINTSVPEDDEWANTAW